MFLFYILLEFLYFLDFKIHIEYRKCKVARSFPSYALPTPPLSYQNFGILYSILKVSGPKMNFEKYFLFKRIRCQLSDKRDYILFNKLWINEFSICIDPAIRSVITGFGPEHLQQSLAYCSGLPSAFPFSSFF